MGLCAGRVEKQGRGPRSPCGGAAVEEAPTWAVLVDGERPRHPSLPRTLKCSKLRYTCKNLNIINLAARTSRFQHDYLSATSGGFCGVDGMERGPLCPQ